MNQQSTVIGTVFNADKSQKKLDYDEFEHSEKMRQALQEFVDRVEKGEIISRYHYRKFKNLLSD